MACMIEVWFGNVNTRGRLSNPGFECLKVSICQSWRERLCFLRVYSSMHVYAQRASINPMNSRQKIDSSFSSALLFTTSYVFLPFVYFCLMQVLCQVHYVGFKASVAVVSSLHFCTLVWNDLYTGGRCYIPLVHVVPILVPSPRRRHSRLPI